MPKKRRGSGHKRQKQSRKSFGTKRLTGEQKKEKKLQQQRERRAKSKAQEEKKRLERARKQQADLESSPPIRVLRTLQKDREDEDEAARLERVNIGSSLFSKSPPVNYLRKFLAGRKRKRDQGDVVKELFKGVPDRKRRKITAILDSKLVEFHRQNEEELRTLKDQIEAVEKEKTMLKKMEKKLCLRN